MNLWKPSLRLMFEADETENSISSKPTEEASVDRQILRHIMDAERTAVKVGKGQKSMTATESIKRASMAFLFEAEGEEAGGDSEKAGLPPIDLGVFATEVMRVVKNYDSLLDIPSVIINRTEDYLQTKYDDETAKQFMEILKSEFDYEPAPLSGPTTSNDASKSGVHFAVGAMPGGGGGA